MFAKKVFSKIKDYLSFPANKKTCKIYNRPLYIEFIGISGVGKSTIFNELSKYEENYCTLFNFIKQNRNIIIDNLIDKDSIYENLAKKQWNIIQNKDVLNSDKFRIAHWNYKTLIEDAKVVKYNKNHLIISDEAILHNFQEAFLEIKEENPKAFKDFLKNRAIVHCFSSKEKILAQIQQREDETGRIVSHHRGKSMEELADLVENELKEKEKFVEILRLYNLPILEIDTQNTIEHNLKEIKNFINQLI